jgi:DNA-binding CsgD family transcriptional regulator/PAS domain-containing protein
MENEPSRHDRLLRLITRVYQAPEDPNGWRAFLSDLCTALDGSAASFISHDFRSLRVQISETVRTDPAALHDYNTHWHAEDPWAHSLRASRLAGGNVVVGDELIESAAMRLTPFYNEFGRRYDIVQDLAGTIEADADHLSCVSINGSARRAPFGGEEKALLQALMPHLKNALQLHRRLAGAGAAAADMRSALDRISHGVALVTRRGGVLFANRAARRLFETGDGITIDAGELRAADPRGRSTLRAAIRSAASILEGASAGGRRLLLDRPSGRRPYIVLVTPVIQRLLEFTPEAPAVMVFLTDPDRFVPPTLERLRTFFGLTVAEARVALALLDGETAAGIAARLAVSVSTVRTHLRQLFKKTGTTRQADLMRLLVTFTTHGID